MKRRGILNTLGLNKRTFTLKFGWFVLILLFSILTITPILYTKKYLMGLWLIVSLISIGFISRTNSKLRQLLILGFAFVGLCTIYKFLGISSASLPYCLDPLVYFGPIIALIIIDSSDNDNQIRFLFQMLSLVIAFNIADSIRITYELGIENMAYQQLTGMLEEEGLAKMNLGGSMFVNMVVFYATLMFFSFLKSKSSLEKIMFFLYLGISTYFIVICSLKASAIILLLISFLLQFIAHRSTKNYGKIIFMSIALLGLILIFRDVIINAMINIIDNDRITSRLVIFTTGGDVSESNTLMNRENLWLVSIQSWLRNPVSFVFGIGDHNWNDFSSTAASGVGNHSDLCDVLARYGLIGGLILYSSIKIYYDYIQKKYGTEFKWEVLSFFVLLIFMGFTKKFVAGEPAIIIFIMLPLCLRLFSRENQMN